MTALTLVQPLITWRSGEFGSHVDVTTGQFFNTTKHKYYLHVHNCILFSLTTVALWYIHSLTDLFIIRKPAWTPVICDNTGTCPNSRVGISVRYCKLCCLKHWDPQFCNRFWNRKVTSMGYLAAQMKWDIHWFTKSVVQHTVKLNLDNSFCTSVVQTVL